MIASVLRRDFRRSKILAQKPIVIDTKYWTIFSLLSSAPFAMTDSHPNYLQKSLTQENPNMACLFSCSDTIRLAFLPERRFSSFGLASSGPDPVSLTILPIVQPLTRNNARSSSAWESGSFLFCEDDTLE